MSLPWRSQIELAHDLRRSGPVLAADMSTLVHVLQVLVVLSRVKFDSASLEDDAGHTSAKREALIGAIAMFCALCLPVTGLCTDSASPQQQDGAGLRGRCLETAAPVVLSMLLFSDDHSHADCLPSVVALLHSVYHHQPARCKMLTAAAATIEDLTSCRNAQGMAPAAESTAVEFNDLRSGAGVLQHKLALLSWNMVQRCYTIPGLQLQRARQSTDGASDAGYTSAVEAAGSEERRLDAALLQLCWRMMAAVAEDFGADTLIQHDSVIVLLHHILQEVLQHGVYELLHVFRCGSNLAAGVQLHQGACAPVWLLAPVVSAMAGAWLQCESEPLPFLPEMLKHTAETISAAAKFFTPDEIRFDSDSACNAPAA